MVLKKKLREAPAATRRLPLVTILCLLLVVSLVIGSGLWSYDRWIIKEQDQRLRDLTAQQAQQRASDVAIYLKQQQKQLAQFAKRGSLRQGLQNNDQQLLQSLSQSLGSAFDQLMSIRVLDLRRNNLLSGTPGPLSFTELDMINRAEQGKAVPPEALRKDKGWSLLLIAPVIADGSEEPIGTLLLTLTTDDLFKRIAAMQPGLGQTQLYRSAKLKPLLIYQSGEGNKALSATSSISDSVWQIQFSPSRKLADQVAMSPVLLLTAHALVGAILLALGYWLTGRVDPARQPLPPSRPAAAPKPKAEAVPEQTAAEENISNPIYQEQDILDIQLAEEDEGLLGLEERERPQAAVASSPPVTENLPAHIFRAYDIRGIAETEITPTLARKVGTALGSMALDAGESCMFVARDGRLHSPELTDELVSGILSSGCNAINLGAVPTPLMYFATCELPESSSGVMVTASHNSGEYNGFKMVIAGKTLLDDGVLAVKSRIEQGELRSGQGEESSQQVIPEYIDRVFSDVALAGDVKLVIDAGNGITGEVAPLLFEELGCDVEPLYCNVDGNFPNHDPDPTVEENLSDLIEAVKTSGADLGLALDGDGDRLVIVTPGGQIIWPDRLLMLFAKDIVSRNPGADVLFDVKCTRELNSLVSSYGGRPIMWKTGHSQMKTKMQETGALIGGELSGHIFIKDRWYGFDDGMYACARLLEIMTLRDQDIDSLFDGFPALPSTPELRVPIAEDRKFAVVQELISNGNFQNGKPITLDGLRVDFAKGWGLVRASNTSAALTLRFEAETEAVLEQVQQLFKRELLKIDSELDLPF
ncbi:phosphomannomutase/phosphoglucomutase [Pseudomaricurvus alkylphenolicus]|uniref:phosphomannomutase/phosphoglucomutase n=1 Tax=Pseudomaricurvus alkylphenolicus TaxID=1306991 RepID=UPI00141DB1D4|nr:phosphomannomutase/phosphoglucomutase [Pseudomaricurvus alkylphenolicus]